MGFSNIDKVDYLCFEGGGGKGVVYLGAVQALEELLSGNGERAVIEPHPPEGDPNESGYSYEPDIKGISGASAGAITAFMLSLGKSSKELKQALEEFYPAGTNGFVNIFETFFDFPKGSEHDGNQGVKFRTIYYENNMIETGNPFKSENTKFTVGYKNFSAEPLSDFWTNVAYNVLKNPTFNLFNLTQEEREQILDSSVYKHVFEYRGPNKTDLGWLGEYRSLLVKGQNLQFAKIFLRNLWKGSGIFLGYMIRRFFTKYMEEYLNSESVRKRQLSGMENLSAETLGFLDFYRISGVDLRLTATNIVSEKPEIFSYEETPNFPVAEAVAISMNIPFVFKPILCVPGKESNGSPSLLSRLRSSNDEFSHAYVDGGMLNNYPLHAFDDFFETSDGLGGTLQYTILNNKILGFNLASKQSPLVGLGLRKTVPALLNTFMYPAEGNQLKTVQEHEQTIYLDPGSIDTLDFSPDPKVAKELIAKAKETTLEYFKS